VKLTEGAGAAPDEIGILGDCEAEGEDFISVD
jgi:hypothetical protein